MLGCMLEADACTLMHAACTLPPASLPFRHASITPACGGHNTFVTLCLWLSTPRRTTCASDVRTCADFQSRNCIREIRSQS